MKSPLDNAKTKVEHIYTGPNTSKVYNDMINCDQEGLLMASTNFFLVIMENTYIYFRSIVQKCTLQKIVHFSKFWVE